MPYLRNAVYVPGRVATALRYRAEEQGVSLEELLAQALDAFALLPALERDHLAWLWHDQGVPEGIWEYFLPEQTLLKQAYSLRVNACSTVQTCALAWQWFVEEGIP